jgi:hypothetical protein
VDGTVGAPCIFTHSRNLPEAPDVPGASPRRLDSGAIVSQDLPIRRLTRLLLVVFLAVLTTSCANSLEPGSDLTVVNTRDVFSLTVQDLADVTDSRSYRWENTGTRASVQILQNILEGIALLSIQDDAGNLVYNETLASVTLNDTTDVGIPGMWTVEVNVEGLTGGFNFILNAQN